MAYNQASSLSRYVAKFRLLTLLAVCDVSFRRSLARQPNHRHVEEVEQAILLIRMGMYLPPLVDVDTPEEPRISERSSPTPGPREFIARINLAEGSLFTPGSDKVQANGDANIEEVPLPRSKLQGRERLLEQGLVRALVGVAENQEDSFQRVCLETLAELSTYICMEWDQRPTRIDLEPYDFPPFARRSRS